MSRVDNNATITPSDMRRRTMNKNIIIALVVGVLVVGGGVLAFVSMRDDSSDSANSDNNASSTTNLVSEDNPLGLDATSLEPPYRATVDSEDSEGRTTNAVLEVDADGDISSVLTDDSQTIEVRSVAGATYTKDNEGNWTKFPATEASEAALDAGTIDTGFSDEDLEDIKQADIVDKGTGPCQAGTCRIYDYTDQDGSTGTVKVAVRNNRISELEVTTAAGEVNTIIFEYDSKIDVVAPENYTEFEIPDFSSDSSEIDSLIEQAQ